jgi:hypothetical protein
MVNNRGISVSLCQWEDTDRVEVKPFDNGSGCPMVHVIAWLPADRRSDGGLNMTHFDLYLREATAIIILQRLARLYPTACMEALASESQS